LILVVYDTENLSEGSFSMSARTRLVLPAPDGAANTNKRPRGAASLRERDDVRPMLSGNVAEDGRDRKNRSGHSMCHRT
jgi:hypothetical protein